MKPEQSLHAAVANYLHHALTPPAWFTTFPSGGGGRARGAQLKRCGLKAGVPDILIIDPYGRARWIELKSDKGRVSDEQRSCAEDLIAASSFVLVCRSIDQVEMALKTWRIPVRAKVA